MTRRPTRVQKRASSQPGQSETHELAEARDHALQKVLNEINERRKANGLRHLQPKERKEASDRLQRAAQSALDQCYVELPTAGEGRDQLLHAVQALRHADDAMKYARETVARARTALKALDDDALDGLFGGCTGDAIDGRQAEYGDPAAPLNLDDFDRFVLQLGEMSRQLENAKEHAIASGFYGPWRTGKYHNLEKWKRELVLDVALILRDFDLLGIVRRSPNGRFHRLVNLVSGMVGLPDLGQSALYSGIDSFENSTKTTNEAEAVLMAARTRTHSSGQ